MQQGPPQAAGGGAGTGTPSERASPTGDADPARPDGAGEDAPADRAEQAAEAAERSEAAAGRAQGRAARAGDQARTAGRQAGAEMKAADAQAGRDTADADRDGTQVDAERAAHRMDAAAGQVERSDERADAAAGEAVEAGRQASRAHQQAAEAADQAARAGERSGEAGDAADRAGQAAQRADQAADDAEITAEDIAADQLIDPGVREVVAGVDEEHPLGHPGEPLTGFSPFRIGFAGTLGVFLAYVLVEAVIHVRQVLVLVLVALFLAVGLDPAVEWLQRRKIRRGFAVAIVLGGVLAFIGGFIAAAATPIASQSTHLVDQAPDYLQRLANSNKTIGKYVRDNDLVNKLRNEVQKGPTLGSGAIGGVIGVGKAVLSALFSVLTTFILTAYFLANFPAIKRGTIRLVPRSRRPRVGLMVDDVARRVGGYVLGNLATSVVAGVAAFIILIILNVPYALALALGVGILDLVPLVGATIAAVVVSVVGLFHSLLAGIVLAAFFVVYQQFENYILVPRVMKRTVNVSPLATIVAALIGGTLLGIVGALLAIPAAATVQMVVREVVYPRQDEG